MSKIGIICAVDRELSPFLEKLQPQALPTQAMLTFYQGSLGDHQLILVRCGVCKVNAAIAAQALIDRFQVDLLINSGTAGGINPSVQLFDTIISEKIAYHDVAPHILTQYHPFMESVYFSADPRLLALMRQCAPQPPNTLRFGTTVTGEQFIDTGMREEIDRQFSPLSADMEGAAIAHVCHVNHIPFLMIRSITDTPTHSGMDHFEQNCEKASGLACEATLALIQKIPAQGL